VDPATDKTPTNENLLDFVKTVPLPEGYTLNRSEIILPMNVTAAWQCFFAIDSMFNFDEALKALGDVYTLESDWSTPSTSMEVDGFSVLKQRRVLSTTRLP